jgi:hypothetical protein
MRTKRAEKSMISPTTVDSSGPVEKIYHITIP